MKLSDFMSEVTRISSPSGEVTAERMVLAIDCSETGNATKVGDYDIASVHVENLGAAISSETVDKNYLYEGKMTIKTDAKRTFALTGQRYLGDAFQDFACSHKIKYGKGDACKRKYVYFNIDSGKGEQGECTIVTNKDGSAAAGSPTDVEIAITSIGIPAEYTYSKEV